MEVKPGYKKTEIGLIPENWEVSKTGELFAFKNGLNKSKENFGHGTPIVNYMDVFKKPFLLKKDISDRVLVNSKEKLAYSVQKGDVFFTRTSETAEEIGITSVMLEETENTVYSGFVLRARPISEKLIDNFKAYCFSANYYRKQVVSKASYTTRALTSGKTLSKTIVAIPPKNEQNLIAEALGDMDALLESLNSLITKKRAIKQATMQQLLSGKARLPEHKDRWQIRRLGDLATMSSGGTPPSSNPEYYDGDIPWVSISDMTKGGKFISKTNRNLTTLGLKNSSAKIFPKNTVLYSIYASLGECSITNIPTSTSQAILGIQTGKSLLPGFLYHYLNYIKPTIASLGQQGTQNNLNKDMVQDFLIPTPSLEEQEKISKIIDEMDLEIKALDQFEIKNSNLKHILTQELLTGRIRLTQ